MNTHVDASPYQKFHASHGDAAVHSLVRFFRLLYRRRAIVAYSLAIAGLLGAIYYGTATRVFTATGAVLVRQTGGEGDVKFSADRSTYAQMATFQHLFTSRVVLEVALQNLKQLPPEISRNLSKEAAIKALRKMLTSRTLRRTSIIEVTAQSEDPASAVRVVNAVVWAYFNYIDQNHRSVSADVIALLKQEREELETRLSQREQELLTAKRNCADFGLSDHQNVVHPLIQNVISLNEVVAETRQKRIELEASLAAVRKTIQSDGDLRQHLVALEPMLGRDILLDSVGMNSKELEVVRETEQSLRQNQTRLAGLLEHFGPAHPEVIDLTQQISSDQKYLNSIKQNMDDKVAGFQSSRFGPMLVDLIEEDLGRIWAKERELTKQYEFSEAKAIELNDHIAAMRIVERNVQVLRNLRVALVNRIENIDINQNNVDVRVSVVSQPVQADKPISPSLLQTGLICLVFGILVGASVVYTLDTIDDHFRSLEELQEYLGIRILAMIRKHEPLDGIGAEALQVNVAPDALESEAFRTLRTTLAFSGEECRRLVVTSSEPSDGKTTVLANLGTSYAQAGKRTLLVDCDLRRPGLTALFELRGSLGTSEILRSEDHLDEIASQSVQQTGVPGMEVIPSGRRPPDSAELLGRDRFGELIAWAETVYDYVLVDSPPMLAATDAAIVGRVVDGMLVVIRPEKNSRRAVLRAFEEITSLGINVLGAVVNGVGQDQNDGYYGYGGYGYGYRYDDGEAAVVENDESINTIKFPEEVAVTSQTDDEIPMTLEHSRRKAS